MLPTTLPRSPRAQEPSWEAEAKRARDHEAEARRAARQAAYRRSNLRLVLSLVFAAYFTWYLVGYPEPLTLGLFLISLAFTAWAVWDTLRTRRAALAAEGDMPLPSAKR